MKRHNRHQHSHDVVEQLRAQVQAAKALESIPDQNLLSDARLNPQTRAQADALAADRLSEELTLEHRRRQRRERERDRVEERAARRAAAIDDARDATNDASLVLDMTTSRKRFVAGALAASVVCSIGSAIGVEAAAQAYTSAPTGMGYVAEVAMTGLSTAAIAWKGGLLRSKADFHDASPDVLAAMIAVPLLASIVTSSFGAGPIGAVCSIGAAAFAWFAYLVSSTGAVAINQAVSRLDGQERPAERPAQAETDRDGALADQVPGDGLNLVADALADQAADYLRSHGESSERSHGDHRSHGPADPSTHPDIEQVGASERPWEQDRSHETDQAPMTAQERRRLEGLHNRRRVAKFLYEHPDATAADIAQALGLGKSTVRRIRKELDTKGGA